MPRNDGELEHGVELPEKVRKDQCTAKPYRRKRAVKFSEYRCFFRAALTEIQKRRRRQTKGIIAGADCFGIYRDTLRKRQIGKAPWGVINRYKPMY